MAERVLAVPFPGLVEVVGVPDDVGPHVTVLYPAPDDVAAIADVLAPFDAFEVTFARLDRFPGTLWLAPEPAEPFVAMTEAMTARFAGFEPYGGVFKSIVPHLTVAQERLDEVAALVQPLLPLRARVESAVLYEETAQTGHWVELAAFDLA